MDANVRSDLAVLKLLRLDATVTIRTVRKLDELVGGGA
jgi:hypothetical protein